MITILIIAFVLLVTISMPFAFALGISVSAAIIILGDIPLTMLPHKMVNGIDSYVFLAIPLFLLAGRLMNAGGITDRLFRFAKVLMGHIWGGLAHANVLASMMFAWMSGSAVAAVGGLGEIEIKAMKDHGYDVPFAASVATAASVLGPIIPPSIPMIMYAAMTGESVGRLFLGGIFPGLLMAALLMVLIYFMAKKRKYPKDKQVSVSEVMVATREAIIPLFMPVIMLGGIAAGIFTPTEAAAIAAAYALVVSLFIYRTVKFKDLPKIFTEAMISTAVITFIISTTSCSSFLLSVDKAGVKLAETMVSFTTNKYIVLFMLNILLLIFGAMMEAGVVLILFTPILYPVLTSLGIDPIHLGVIMCANLMIGVATPPVGVCLFMMSHISKLKMEVLMKAILPFLIPIIIALLLFTYIDGIVLFLPDLFMPN